MITNAEIWYVKVSHSPQAYNDYTRYGLYTLDDVLLLETTDKEFAQQVCVLHNKIVVGKG